MDLNSEKTIVRHSWGLCHQNSKSERQKPIDSNGLKAVLSSQIVKCLWNSNQNEFLIPYALSPGLCMGWTDALAQEDNPQICVIILKIIHQALHRINISGLEKINFVS